MNASLHTLLVVLAVFAFAAAIYSALRVGLEAAAALALIGVLLLVFS